MKLTILSTSDVHGYIYPTDFTQANQNDAPYSLSRAASIIAQERQQATGPVITCDLGDFLQGSALATYLAKQHNPRLLQAYQPINYDFGLLGNHEFNYGQTFLQQALQYANYPILCANITDQHNHYIADSLPYKIMHFGQLSVAFIGVTTAYIPHWENPAHITNLKFQAIIPTLRRLIPFLRKQVDIIVVCYHGGFEKDIEDGSPLSNDLENEGYALLHEVKGIDALVTGHQHLIIAGHLCGVPVTQPGSRGAYVGKIVLDIQQHDNGTYYVNDSQATVIPTATATPDTAVLNTMTDAQQATEQWLDQPVGTLAHAATFTDAWQVRTQGCAYITLINQIQMAAMHTDIAATSLFNDRAHGFDTRVTMRDILMNYIYANTLVAETIIGSELRAALEKCASYFTVNDGQLQVNPDFDFSFNYDMYSGIDYIIDARQPIGQRIVKLRYHDHDVQPDEKLTIALNQYRGVGGGDYTMFNTDKIISANHDDMLTIIAKYLAEHPLLEIKNCHNFKVIY